MVQEVGNDDLSGTACHDCKSRPLAYSRIQYGVPGIPVWCPRNSVFQSYMDSHDPSEPRGDNLLRIARTAGVTPEWLLYGTMTRPRGSDGPDPQGVPQPAE